jgi:hypothetical protein
MNTALAIVLAVAAVVIVFGGVLYAQRRRSRLMRARYGAEYAATVDEVGDRRRAEAELKRREQRVQAFDIRPLSAGEAERYAERWRRVQAEFVDSPGAAIARADELLGEVMHARGYPVGDFEQRAADLSVDHPKLVADYRAAHEVAQRHARGEAGTEDLRRAMIHYRDLFEELVERLPEPQRPPEPRSFQAEPQDERAAPGRGEIEDVRAEEPAARQRRRRDDRTGGGPAPRV